MKCLHLGLRSPLQSRECTNTCFESTHQECLFCSWFARPKFRNRTYLYSIEWKWKGRWWHGAEKLLDRVSGSAVSPKSTTAAPCPACRKVQGLTSWTLVSRSPTIYPSCTLLNVHIGSERYGALLKCIGAKFDPCNQQPTPRFGSAFQAVNKVPTTPRKIDPRHLYLLSIRERAWLT